MAEQAGGPQTRKAADVSAVAPIGREIKGPTALGDDPRPLKGANFIIEFQGLDK